MQKLKGRHQLTTEKRTYIFLVDTSQKAMNLIGLNGFEFPIIEVIINALRNFVEEYIDKDRDEICIILYNTKATKNE